MAEQLPCWLLLAAGDDHVAVDLSHEALEHFARTEFDEFGSAVGNHVFHRLSPTDGSGELSHEVGFDFGGVGVGKRVDVLVDGANGGVELGSLDGRSEFGACRLHARRVESAAHFEFEGTFCAGGEKFLASGVDGFNFAGDYDLSGAVVVGANDNAVDAGANLFDGFVGEGEHGGHSRGLEFAGFLHGFCAGRDEAEAVLKGHCAGSHEG